MKGWLTGGIGAALLSLAAIAQADWWIVYSPVIVKHTGQSTYCCFPTKAECEAARAQKLQPADSIGCSGFDSPSAKQKQSGQPNKAQEEKKAKEAAAKKAAAEQQRKKEEALFRQEQADALNAFKGGNSEGAGNGGGLALKPVPPAGGSALNQLRCGAAWSGAAAHASSAEQARADAERGAQGAGGMPCPEGTGAIPEPPAPTPVDVQQQFQMTLHERQQATQQRSQQTAQQIQTLERKIEASEAETARREQALAGLALKETPGGQAQESDAQRKAREALERAKAERQKLQQELERRRREREQLAQDERRLQQLEARYQADPQRADELMGQLGR